MSVLFKAPTPFKVKCIKPIGEQVELNYEGTVYGSITLSGNEYYLFNSFSIGSEVLELYKKNHFIKI